jgi:signal transduction histidine kinase
MTAEQPKAWGGLTAWLASLPEDARQDYFRQMQTFAHDLRQPLGQIQSAEELLRRALKKTDANSDLIELLDIVREANMRASAEVSDFVDAFLDGFELPDS